MSSLTAYVLSSQTSSLSGLFSLTPVSSSTAPVSQLPPSNPVLAQEQAQISGYGQLLSALSSFQYALQGMELPHAVTQNLSTSSNSAVATATTSIGAKPSTYNIVVTSMAQAQSIQSNSGAGLADPNNTLVGSGTLNIQLGTYNAGPNTFTSVGSSVAITISGGSLSSIASAINGANAGVTATVAQDATGFHLLTTSTTPGPPNGFKITITNDSDGNNTNMAGLSQLAYDPTAAVGSGKNQTQVQAAASSVYTVNGASAISTTNTGISLAQGVSLNLLQTGSSTIAVGPDFNGLQTSAQNFISAYNTLQNSIANLTGTSGPLAYDSLSTQLISDLNKTTRGTYSNGTSLLTSLSQIGINFQYGINGTAGSYFYSGGTLSLNANTLQNAFSSDSAGSVSLLSQAIQGFDNLAQQYNGVGGSIYGASQSLQKLATVEQYLSLGQNFFDPANNLPSISNLLAAQPANRSGTGYTAQQIQAIQQYARVSTLSQAYNLNAAIIAGMFGMGASQRISAFA